MAFFISLCYCYIYMRFLYLILATCTLISPPPHHFYRCCQHCEHRTHTHSSQCVGGDDVDVMLATVVVKCRPAISYREKAHETEAISLTFQSLLSLLRSHKKKLVKYKRNILPLLPIPIAPPPPLLSLVFPTLQSCCCPEKLGPLNIHV